MVNRAHDRVLSATLVALSLVWIWLVVGTIPAGLGGGDIGARAFPLTFGILLLGLASLMAVRAFFISDAEAETAADSDDEVASEPHLMWVPALLLLVEIALYGFLLEKIGFVLATPVIILLVMVVNLRVRSLLKLVMMSLGLTVGCWLIFEKILGIYLANGIWINLG